MASHPSDTVSAYRSVSQGDDLLLRETNHRCANDLQLVVSLLALQSSKATSDEARQALTDAMERVSILARARTALQQQVSVTLEGALGQICKALHSQAEPRSIQVSLDVEGQSHTLSAAQITTLALTVNELVTNAIKHAFKAGAAGRISIAVRDHDKRHLAIFIDDDGLPLPDVRDGKSGLGLGLVRRLVASIGGLVILPTNGSKCFEIRVPVSNR